MVQTKKFEQTFVNEYLARMLHERDVEKRAKAAGLAEGRAEGRAAGLAEGRTEGRAEGQSVIVRNMISLGKSFAEIASLTGLSENQVRSFSAVNEQR